MKAMAGLLAATMAMQAMAADELVPRARLSLEFGGSSAQPIQAWHLRLRLLAEQSIRIGGEKPTQPLALASLEFGSDAAPYSTLLGVPMPASADRSLANAGESSGGSRTWLWVTGGVIATVAVIAVAVGGSDKETNENTGGPASGCIFDANGDGICDVGNGG